MKQSSQIKKPYSLSNAYGLLPANFRIEHWQLVNIILAGYDVFAVNAAYFLALWIRFDCRYSTIPPEFLRAFVVFSPVYSVLCVAIFWFYSLYQSLWRFASYMELVRTLTASLVTCSIHAVLITVLFQRMPFTYYVFGAVLQFLAVVGMRFSYRLMLLLRGLRQKNEAEAHMSRVMLIGAGTAGQMILRDVQNTDKLKNRICCIIDDNSNKWNRFMDGIPIVGGRQSIIENVEKYKIEKIFLAIPRATAKERQDILDICKETGCELKQLPAMYQLVSGEVSVGTMRDVAVEDLLGREPIKTDLQEVFAFLNDKTILVTGGGGSIGSELCRQIAARHPKQLIIFDIYENNAYAIQLELKKKHPELNLTVLIGSVRDSRRLQQVFSTYRPEIVY